MATDTLTVSPCTRSMHFSRSLSVDTDEQIARSVQQGRIDDLALLVERHHSSLLGFLYRMTGGDRALAEDLVQDTFLHVLRSIRQYRPAQRLDRKSTRLK